VSRLSCASLNATGGRGRSDVCGKWGIRRRAWTGRESDGGVWERRSATLQYDWLESLFTEIGRRRCPVLFLANLSPFPSLALTLQPTWRLLSLPLTDSLPPSTAPLLPLHTFHPLPLPNLASTPPPLPPPSPPRPLAPPSSTPTSSSLTPTPKPTYQLSTLVGGPSCRN
jgi:hypothetical protein